MRMWKHRLKKKSQRGTKIKPVENKQSDSSFIWESYSKGFNKKRLLFEFIIPGFLALSTLSIYLLSYSSITTTLLKIKDINSEFFTIIAIQIGFNITSLALIGAFNKETLRDVFSKIREGKKKEKALKQLLASFIYCV